MIIRHCKWCGREFKITAPNQQHCKEHREEARKENHRNRQRNYRKKYKDNKIGTGLLGMHKHQDNEKELESIEKEMRRLRLKNKKKKPRHCMSCDEEFYTDSREKYMNCQDCQKIFHDRMNIIFYRSIKKNHNTPIIPRWLWKKPKTKKLIEIWEEIG